MYKVFVKLKDNPTQTNSPYLTNDLYRIVQEEASKCDLVIIDKFTYTVNESKHAFGNCWKFIFSLRRLNWFQDYIEEWFWYDDTIITSKNPDGSEDLIKNFLNR